MPTDTSQKRTEAELDSRKLTVADAVPYVGKKFLEVYFGVRDEDPGQITGEQRLFVMALFSASWQRINTKGRNSKTKRDNAKADMEAARSTLEESAADTPQTVVLERMKNYIDKFATYRKVASWCMGTRAYRALQLQEEEVGGLIKQLKEGKCTCFRNLVPGTIVA